MSEWKECTLGDVLNFRRGYDLPKSSMIHGDVPVAGSNGIIGWHNVATNISPIVTIGRSGSIGRPNIYTKAWAHNTTLYIDDFKGNHPKYLYYLLFSLPLAEAQAGSAVPTLNRNHIHPLPIVFPKTLEEQQKIAGILSALDEKIETNRRINARLEEMAHALFKSWFIDFEPFGGKMPEDWEDCNLGDLTTECKEKVKTRTDVRVLSPVSSGELVLSDEYFTKQVYSKELSKYIIVKPNTFAYNPARVNIGSIGRNEFDFNGCVSPVYVVFEAIDGYSEFINRFIKTHFFKNEVLLRAIGGVRQTLSYTDFSLIEFIKPTLEVVTRFTESLAPLYKKMATLNEESVRLAALRDTLLPKLMSGELIPQ